jgi:serine/threonine protein kinase
MLAEPAPAFLKIILLIAAIMGVAILGMLGLALVVFVLNKLMKTGPVAPPVNSPPVQSTRISRKCPQCGTALRPDVPEGLCPACLLQRGIATEGGVPPGTPPFTPPPLAELAKLFPQLEILEIIGQGGMGAVYKARQPALDRFVALKILAPRSGGDLDFSGRFSREARALAKLSHPNIVAVYDFGQIQRGAAPDSPRSTLDPHFLSYFLMEYVDGPNLRQLEQAGKLAPREALQIIPQICAALQFAHDEGIVHRDIKPENVLLDKKGRVKIADFGLAKIVGQEADFRLTGARDIMGTPHYMAPEQVEKPQEVDHRADIYSLGVVFYEMLTGELPLGKFDPPSHKVQIDVRLDEVVLRSLANNPDRRYQHVSEVKTELESIAGTPQARSADNRAPGSFQNVPHQRNRFGWQFAFVMTVGIGAVLVVASLFWLKINEVPTTDPIIPIPPNGRYVGTLGINPSTGRPGRAQTAVSNSDEDLLLAQQPAVVVETFPISGAHDVPAGETEIRVRFSKPMQNGSWSWSEAWRNSTPESIGSPRYLEDGRTCVAKVRLEPGHTYGWWLNSEQLKNFTDRAGRPSVPYLFTFQTQPK